MPMILPTFGIFPQSRAVSKPQGQSPMFSSVAEKEKKQLNTQEIQDQIHSKMKKSIEKRNGYSRKELIKKANRRIKTMPRFHMLFSGNRHENRRWVYGKMISRGDSIEQREHMMAIKRLARQIKKKILLERYFNT